MSDETPGPRCDGPEHRQFDFWLGEWDVFDPGGGLVGRNRITSILGGCALRERWEGVRGLTGTSLNIYAAGRGQWHQTWVDSSGALLLLDGGMRDGAMVLEGSTPPRDYTTGQLHHRISWSVMDANPDRVRQHWETSADDGRTWETAFDGHYRRRSG